MNCDKMLVATQILIFVSLGNYFIKMLAPKKYVTKTRYFKFPKCFLNKNAYYNANCILFMS